MRVIICGAGQVGYHIAAYLAREDSDVTVVDTNADLIAHINDELDVNGIVGHASKPETLSQAGAATADMILAVTSSDEVNMLACQVAHSLFNVPKKIARVRDQAYLEAEWSNLFSRTNLPIDTIVSPEIEVAKAIYQRLTTPGTSHVVSLARNHLKLVSVVCDEACPLMHTQFKQIPVLFPGLYISIGAILRNGAAIIPDANDQVVEGDEVFFFTTDEHLKRSMAAFGHEEKKARHITLIGGGNIGLYLAELLHEQSSRTRLKIIESDEAQARLLSETLENTIVLHGDGLQQEILKEANISKTETLIAITNDDETNILSSLLAKNMGCERVITLVNKPDYAPLVVPLGIDATVSPRAITVSSIMQHVRRGRVKELHNICNGAAEVIEIEVSDNAAVVNKAITEANLPRHVRVGGILRGDKVFMPGQDYIFKTGDRVIILAAAEEARQIEKMFMPEVNLF